jgi:tousled-like kinase
VSLNSLFYVVNDQIFIVFLYLICFRLKRQTTIPEKDARAIVIQIISGLRYLAHPFTYTTPKDSDGEESNGTSNKTLSSQKLSEKQKISIIHYDLKPANILFDETGDVKITDFGLSKVINEDEEGTSMELTSLGAGTYWYLPPECLIAGENGGNPV